MALVFSHGSKMARGRLVVDGATSAAVLGCCRLATGMYAPSDSKTRLKVPVRGGEHRCWKFVEPDLSRVLRAVDDGAVERLEVVAHDLVQRCRLRAVALVAGGAAVAGGGGRQALERAKPVRY